MKNPKLPVLLYIPPRALAFVRQCGASSSSVLAMVGLLLGKAAVDTFCALLVAALLGALLPMGRAPGGWYAQFETLWAGLSGSGASALPLLVVALVLGKGVLSPLMSALRGRLIDAWTLLISLRIFQRELSRPVPQLSNNPVQGSSVAVSYLVPRVVTGTLLPSLELLTEALVVSALFCVLLMLEPAATLVMLGALLVAVGLGSALSLFLGGTRNAHKGNTQMLMQRWVTDGMACLREVRLYNRVPAMLQRYSPVARRYARATARERTFMDIQSPIMELFFLLVLVVCVLVASQGIGQTDLHVLALFSAVGLRLLPGFRRILSSLQTLRFCRPFFEELASDFPARTFSASTGHQVEPAPSPSQTILLCESLQYRYPQANQAVIQNLDLCLRRGEWVGLVGESGAGKSTLVDLLIGELQPSQGKLQRPAASAEGRAFGYAAAFTTLIPGTLRDNVTFLGNCPDHKVREALTIAGIDSLLTRLPHGLDTPVEEFEQRISSGERQRIGLARAVAHGQLLLILDEATASLDQVTESRFLQALRAARPDLAVVLITHRLTALRHTDRNLLMVNGALDDFIVSPQQDACIDIPERLPQGVEQ
jgi:ABC-type bacteriocin/lantibiotic exporter with double-glycine peptidase domain